jgi:uncharacterized protein (TIGR02246 family)
MFSNCAGLTASSLLRRGAVTTAIAIAALNSAASRAAGQDAPAAASSDEADIRAAAEAYEKAYAAGDSKTLAAMFTEDAELTDPSGRTIEGREAIGAEFATTFAREPGGKIDVRIDSIKFITPDVALESGTAQSSSSDGRAAAPVRYTALHVKRNGTWLLQSVNEKPSSTAADSDPLNALAFLIGSWRAQVGAGKTYELECQWMPGNKFIQRQFSIVEGATPINSGVQVIGFDPVLGQIVSWTFDSTGGFGHELWEREDGRWRIQASSTLPDGGSALATNFLTPGDNDSFTWQSVDRSLNGQLLPDTAVVRVKRVAK